MRVLITHNFLVKQPLRIVIVIVIIIASFYVRLHVGCQFAASWLKGVGLHLPGSWPSRGSSTLLSYLCLSICPGQISSQSIVLLMELGS